MFEWFNTDITAKEIETSIRKLKTNESPGNDQLTNGYFMNSATYLSLYQWAFEKCNSPAYSHFRGPNQLY